MANLFDQTPQNIQEFNPAADNRKIPAQAGVLGKTVYIIFSIFTLGIPYMVTRNKLLEMQNKINELASGIDVQLTKRHDTLTKLLKSVSSYKKFEADLYSDIARLRSLINNNSVDNAGEIERLNSNVFGRLFAVSENYPQLQASELYRDLMEQSTYIEKEISASRRIYNQEVTRFNTTLFVWPSSVVASFLGLATKPLYQAAHVKREDVSFDSLN
ncbi:LemA family protein [Mycoplasmopsis cricetuli]|uniref:LemA family protein n=1 Tax=Mycoplasmopsis cricetuli TaxID=171283 RepID=UPI000470C01F|nr:LemA family protein [Mycoplasmopsis cricetuli]